MIVNSFGYSIVAPKHKHQSLIEQLHSLTCLHLNLCASVGCSCVTGSSDPPLCYESNAGSSHPVYHSEGPTWSVLVRTLPTHVVLDIHTRGPVFQTETSELYLAICDLATSTGCGAVSFHSTGHVEVPDDDDIQT